MLYAILCYNREDEIQAWSKAQHEKTMGGLAAVSAKLAKAGRLGPVARLLPTTAATTLRKDREPMLVLDGPFAETKEQLLGFYIFDCDSLEEVIAAAKDLLEETGALELRPLRVYFPAPKGK